MWLTNLFGRFKNINSELASYKKKQVRLGVCESCPLKKDSFRFLFFKKEGEPQCSICGCAIHDKVLWLDEKCPLDKW